MKPLKMPEMYHGRYLPPAERRLRCVIPNLVYCHEEALAYEASDKLDRLEEVDLSSVIGRSIMMASVDFWARG